MRFSSMSSIAFAALRSSICPRLVSVPRIELISMKIWEQARRRNVRVCDFLKVVNNRGYLVDEEDNAAAGRAKGFGIAYHEQVDIFDERLAKGGSWFVPTSC